VTAAREAALKPVRRRLAVVIQMTRHAGENESSSANCSIMFLVIVAAEPKPFFFTAFS
jgi:hypothetical protein